MRFERLTFDDKINNLKRLHKHLNKHLFSNCLDEIDIDIEHLDARAMFYEADDHISICSTYISDVISSLSIKDQILSLATVMLHEMIHQYCFENNIDTFNSSENGHNEKYIEEALNHGLIVNKDLSEEHLELRTIIEISNFRFK